MNKGVKCTNAKLIGGGGDSIKIGKLSYKPTDVIGKGGFGKVYRGLYSSKRPVAIKRLYRIYDERQFAIQQQEVDLMKAAGDHPNILGYIHKEMNADFLYKQYIIFNSYRQRLLDNGVYNIGT